jgi:hypothetical protein
MSDPEARSGGVVAGGLARRKGGGASDPQAGEGLRLVSDPQAGGDCG